MKTKKSITSRIRARRSGKLIRRHTKQSHFRAKESGKRIRKKRQAVSLGPEDRKIFKKYLSA